MENIDIQEIRQTFKELITNLLEDKMDRKTVAKLTRKRVELGYILECKDKCITHSYFALAGVDDPDCNTLNSELLYLKGCLEGEREYSDEDKFEFVLNSEEPICSLVPSLSGQEINLGKFWKYAPEKLELYDGNILSDKVKASKLLALLIYNLGVETVVKLIDRRTLLKALELDDKKMMQRKNN